MSRLYRDPIYRGHLAGRADTQTIMVGFSDGTKDGGYVTANWEIYRAKQRLTEVSRAAGVRVVFFDGRGGPPARGGGNTHLYYRALGREIESREIQLTIQGQTISSKFGTEDVARYNLEQLLSAGIENALFTPDTPQLSAEDVAVLDKLSMRSRAAYLEHSLFFRTMVENAMQSLSKSNFDLTAFLDDHPVFGEFWRRLRDEARRTGETFERLSASGSSPVANPSALESIRTRERMILPVLVIQQYALAMLRDEPPAEIAAVLEKIVIKSLAPSINASRNAV